MTNPSPSVSRSIGPIFGPVPIRGDLDMSYQHRSAPHMPGSLGRSGPPLVDPSKPSLLRHPIPPAHTRAHGRHRRDKPLKPKHVK